MPLPTTRPLRHLLLAVLGASTSLAGSAAIAHAAPKPSGPPLAIEAKACNVGAEPTDRTIVLTASAVLQGTGDEVQMRFTVQQRATPTSAWTTVLARTGDLGTWVTSEPGSDGLRYTKTIGNLAEGTYYRVFIDARAVTNAGKAATKTTRRTYQCSQPQYSAKVIIEKARWKKTPGATTPSLAYTLRNIGREPSGDILVTLTDPATGNLLATAPSRSLSGGERRQGTLATATCPAILATLTGDDPAASDATQDTAAISCPASTNTAAMRRTSTR